MRAEDAVDYRIRRDPGELDSTGYMEIGPGPYDGKHWQVGFIFVWEDAFGMADGILAKHVPAYDHFSMNNILKGQGSKVVEEWRCVAGRLADMSVSEVSTALNLAASYRSNLDSEVASHRREISLMLRELADACHAFYERSESVCVLGM